MYTYIKKTIIRILEITRVVLVAMVAKLRHQFTRYRRGPNKKVWDIDIVYLWSDPSDLEWSKKRLQVLKSESRNDFCCINDQTISSTVTLDELRYSLRSIDSHLEGFRYVHVVVDGQIPEWLNLDHPQLRVIEAKNIITDKNHYPNYNTQAIESYFFNIPDLTNRFIYFNDDFFLSRKTGVDEFYTSDGLIKVRLGRALSPRGIAVPEEEGDSAGHKNANKILDDRFGKRARLTVMHRPYAHNKAILKEAEEDFSEAFEETRSSRFRSTKMVAVHSFLVLYTAAHLKKADLVPPRLLEKDMFKWGECPNSNHKVTQRIRSLRGNGFCIQEERGIQIPESEVSRFHEFMSDLFPEPSSFEKE